MASKICMNELCRTTSSYEWKNGWTLKYGGLATLCQPCGIAYENLVFCDTFHLELDGWIECRICGKRIHLGCIASRMLHEYLDLGGVSCISCTKRLESRSIRPLQIPGDVQPASVNGMDNRMLDKGGLLQMVKVLDVNGPRHLCVSQKEETTASLGQLKGKETIRCGKVNESFTNFRHHPLGSSTFVSPDQSRSKQGVKDVYESLAQPSLSLSTPVISSSSIVPFPSGGAEASDQGQKARQILPKPPKPVPTTSSEMNTEMVGGKIRIARPPAEGRGRHQLLPRYWPRITDQEIQQISGDLKATIAPLFEKVLSASDAGRIGRLVLPKACAEAYFPTINQSEGMPIRIQDVKGKEWTFQFRFWPNNNSRMYVLEGVTPCIQNMQLQASDTVTFSRLEPSGQLVMGFRKATNNGDMQEAQPPVLPNGGGTGEASVSGASDNVVINGSRNSEEKKKARNIGLKNKRLLMNSDDATELKVTWDEAHELMRPAPNAKPKVVMIEGVEIEEYDEPPIFGKKTVLTVLASGEQEQWAKCDNCSKWRKLPVDVLLPAKWTCSDNVWDLNRSSCSAPEEISPGEQEAISQANKDGKKQKMGETNRAAEDSEPTGLDALATAATLDNIGSLAEPSSGATTRHPRHRPGCSCIVCIQPPSGKGKHPPNCKCNVCSTVKRRFKTLMMRKKKRQSEREAAEMAQQGKEQPLSEVAAGDTLVQVHQLDNGRQMEVGESSSMGQLDLNSHPSREDDMLAEATAGLNMATLMNAASLPFEMYLEQNGLSNLSCLLSNNGDGETLLPDEAEEEAGEKDDDDEE